jgi:hypothetical protein
MKTSRRYPPPFFAQAYIEGYAQASDKVNASRWRGSGSFRIGARRFETQVGH